MPNHCQNEIIIKGPKDKIDSFWNNLHKGENGEPSFSSMLPMPKVLEGTRAFPLEDSNGDVPEETLDKWKEYLADEDNDLWTQEYYDAQVKEWREGYERSKRAKAETGFSGWYEWRISDENWGTKWGDYETYVRREEPYDWESAQDYYIIGSYDTAWSPFANKFWEQISDRYFGVSFVISYREDGMCFEGSQTFFNGECLFDECVDINTHHSSAMNSADEARHAYAEEIAEIKNNV